MADAAGADEVKEADYNRLNRRMIYMHRLAGDDVFVSKVQSIKKASIAVVPRFLCYAAVATFVITERSQVTKLSEANEGVLNPLKHQHYEFSPDAKKFDDIRQVADVQQWLRRIVQEIRISGGPFRPLARDLSLQSFNRVTPLAGVCMNWASLTLTLRQVRTTEKSELTTTSRFAPLYPSAWVAAAIPAGQAASELAEYTEPIVATSSSWAGNVTWLHTKACNNVTWQTWCPLLTNAGYKNTGGYIAVVAIHSDGGAWVHLVDNDDTMNASQPDKTYGVCDDRLKRSGTVPLEEFLSYPFFTSTMGSIAVEFQTYNSNYQSISRVSSTFDFSGAGIISSKVAKSETVLLDISHEYLRFFEVLYLLLTCCYFFELVYRIWRGFPGYFKNLWCYVNTCSIIGSLASLSIWYSYMPKLHGYLTEPAFQDPAEFKERFDVFGLYIVASSFATFTIYLRLLQFLAATKSRVVLLLKTISFSAGNMILYVSYIGIIFMGFTTFAMTHFSNKSINFVDPWRAFVSCFSLFLGKLDVVADFDAPLKVPFMMTFLFFFFFMSVQMFNAIINYAYNRVSEDMQAVFEREANEQQRKELDRAMHSGGKSWYQQLMEAVNRTQKKNGKSSDADVGEGFGVGVEDAEPEKGEEEASPWDMEQDPKVRKKVQEYLHREGNATKSAKDGAGTVMMYLVYVGCYIWFLYVNMLVEYKGDIKTAFFNEIYAREVAVPRVSLQDGSTYELDRINWHGVKTLSETVAWISEGVPMLIFNSSSYANMQLAEAEGFISPGQICIKNWNCLISGQISAGGSPKLVRITQKRGKTIPNNGASYATTPENDRFIGGYWNDTGVANSRVLVNVSGFSEKIGAGSAGSPAENTNPVFNLTYEGAQFCSSISKNTAESYERSGGIVCLLDRNLTAFNDQMALMLANDFFTSSSATFAVEMVSHNSNADLLTYLSLVFEMQPSGRVEKSATVSSLALFNFDIGVDNLGVIVGRIFPGLVYNIMVFIFTVMLYRELKLETTKMDKGRKPSGTFFQGIFSFFARDIFRIFDAMSTLLSLASTSMFIVWLAKDSSLDKVMLGDFNSFLDYTSELTGQERLYNRLSALNLLLIFVRPLRFMRDNPRMARLNQTLWQAQTDITWFIVVLFVVLIASMLFAYVSFGPNFPACSTIPLTFNYCFFYILGHFDFWPLYDANPVMAVVFFFPYLLLFYCVFTNIFFAMVDRFFISEDPPPVNLKRKLKPIFSKVCRCIQWEDDFVMEEDPNAEKKLGPKSRAARVEETAKIIRDVYYHGGEVEIGQGQKKSKLLSEICDPDERLANVMRWSRDEAKSIVLAFRNMLAKKQESQSDDSFIKNEVMAKVGGEERKMRHDMEEAFRQMRYATEVHEVMAARDQNTLARYILLLEAKIKTKMVEKHSLLMEVHHLRGESDNMRFSKDDLKAIPGQAGANAADLPEDEEESEESEQEAAAAVAVAEEDAGDAFGESVRDPTAPSEYLQTHKQATSMLLESLDKLS
ncbi:unnamed protein product [Polarella glacialis]|uniref:Polycystin cation channel PKD1/PKD2 domain-containing protein n=1 Tax=Polarella glacialis TaxID=89957 RepID=A0A813I392_POLGL|nr:unnamed protein product [Polarella glacialis]